MSILTCFLTWISHLHESRLLMQRTEEVLPFIYTPTVGEACQRYHELPLNPYGVYISLDDRGKVAQRLQSLGGSLGGGEG